jgi:cytochrome c peroxidase
MRIKNAWAVCLLVGTLTATAAYAGTVQVTQKDKTFSPDTISAPVGTIVHVANDDGVVHNVLITSPDGSVHNTGMQKVGESVDVALDKAGEYQIRCGIHPKMKLTISAQ